MGLVKKKQLGPKSTRLLIAVRVRISVRNKIKARVSGVGEYQ